jgi:hypothetical protein
MKKQTPVWRSGYNPGIILIILLGFIVGTGCIQDSEKPVTPAPGPAVLLDYHRTGGIGGFDDHLVIFENGATVISTRSGNGYAVLKKSELEEIRALFARAGFSSLNESFPAPSPGADYFSYQITYQGRTVTTEDTGIPAALDPVITALNDIVATKRNMNPENQS